MTTPTTAEGKASAVDRLALAHHNAEILYHGQCGNQSESWDDHIEGHRPCFSEDENEDTRNLIRDLNEQAARAEAAVWPVGVPTELAEALARCQQARAEAAAEIAARARAAVEPHLLNIVNRTRPMDQAEGLAILADLQAALADTAPTTEREP